MIKMLSCIQFLILYLRESIKKSLKLNTIKVENTSKTQP